MQTPVRYHRQAMVDVPKNKHQQRNEASTRAMLDATASLIVEGGLDAVTLAAVGERSGYSRGLASARFGSKAGLIDALIDRISYRWRQRVFRPAGRRSTGIEAALVFIEAIWTQMERDDTHLRVFYTLVFEAVGPDPLIRSRIADLNQEQLVGFADYLARGVEDGSIRNDIDVEAEAQLIVAGLRGMAFLWMVDAEQIDGVAAMRTLYDSCADRLATPFGRERLAGLAEAASG